MTLESRRYAEPWKNELGKVLWQPVGYRGRKMWQQKYGLGYSLWMKGEADRSDMYEPRLFTRGTAEFLGRRDERRQKRSKFAKM